MAWRTLKCLGKVQTGLEIPRPPQQKVMAHIDQAIRTAWIEKLQDD